MISMLITEHNPYVQWFPTLIVSDIYILEGGKGASLTFGISKCICTCAHMCTHADTHVHS